MRFFALFLLIPALLHAGPVGFASLTEGTSGGGDSKIYIVRTAAELRDALERTDVAKEERDRTPRVIRLAGDIDLTGLANGTPGKELGRTGVIRPRSHTTLEGPAGGAVLKGGTIELKRAENVIVRNLRFRGLWEHDPSGEYDELGWDYVRVSSSRRVWIDRCDFGRVYDGHLDIIHGSDLVTVSRCIFSGENDAAQKKSMLIGNSPSEKARATDGGHLNVTIHGCWFRDIGGRAPRLRHGNVHFLNNLVENAGSGTVSVCGGATLVEGCVYRNCKLPTAFSYADDTVEKRRGGSIRVLDSLDLGKHSGDRFRDHPPAFAFNAPSGFVWGSDRSKLPYLYEAVPAAEVEALIKREAGPR